MNRLQRLNSNATRLFCLLAVLLLTALQMLLAGTTLPYATRAILYGLVVLSAVMALRERRLQ